MTFDRHPLCTKPDSAGAVPPLPSGGLDSDSPKQAR